MAMLFNLFWLFFVTLTLLVLLGSIGLAVILCQPPRLTVGKALAHGLPTEPSDLGFTCATHTVLTSPSHKTECWVINGTQPNGPTLLLLHPWGDSCLGMLSMLDNIINYASHIVMFDLPGHGESSIRCWTWCHRERKQIAKLVAHFKGVFADLPLIVMGYSMGGVLAIESASEAHPDAVIADSPYQNLRRTIRAALRQRRLPVWPIADLAVTWLTLFGLCPMRTNIARTASTIDCPLLLFHGKNDGLVPTSNVYAIAHATPDATLVSLPSANHCQGIMVSNDVYADELARFIGKISDNIAVKV